MPEASVSEPNVAEDALYGGRVRLLQPRRGHRAGTDAVLLAAMAEVEAGEGIADVGAGTGAVGLMIAARTPGAGVLFVERDPFLAGLCRENIVLNGCADRAHVLTADVLASAPERRAEGLRSGTVEVVATNPPFLEAGRARSSPDSARAVAHEMPVGGLERWLGTCADLLVPRGRLALIHRADRLGDLLAVLRRGFGGLTLRFVQPRAEEPAIRVLVKATKGSKAPLVVLPPLVLHDGAGRFTPEAEALHRGAASLAGSSLAGSSLAGSSLAG